MELLTEEEFLRRIFIKKIAKDWGVNCQTKWKNEFWFKIHTAKCNNSFQFPGVESLPNGFFEFLEVDLCVVIRAFLNLKGKKLSYYTSSASSLKRFLGKNRDPHKRFFKKKIGLIIYAGYDGGNYYLSNWQDFKRAYRLYKSFWESWEVIYERKSIGFQNYENKDHNLNHQSEYNQHYRSDFGLVLTKQKEDILSESYFLNRNSYISSELYRPRKKWTIKYVIMSLALVLIFSIGFKDLGYEFGTSEIKEQDLEFKTHKFYKGENRFSVSVIYDVGDIDYDKLAIQIKGDSNYEKINLKNSRDTLSFMFHKPFGRLILLVYKGDKVLKKEIKMSVPTTGWIGWVNGGMEHDKKISAYLKRCDMSQDGRLVFPDEFIPLEIRSYYFTHYSIQKNFSLDAKSLEMAIRFRLEKIPSDATCNNISFYLGGETNLVNVNFELSGCEYYGGLSISDKKYTTRSNAYGRGLHSDLAKTEALTHSETFYRNWNIFRVKVENDSISLWMNEHKIKQIWNKDVNGHVEGLGISTKGTWSIDWVELTDKYNNSYREDFSDCNNVSDEDKIVFYGKN